ncbi:hypothetical protein [Haloplanus sp. C73]|uniref:hypothetical protein n=1 Tax=Haloplanus sp. C73 TaxID=3421641 RepID=UPI003EB72407
MGSESDEKNKQDSIEESDVNICIENLVSISSNIKIGDISDSFRLIPSSSLLGRVPWKFTWVALLGEITIRIVSQVPIGKFSSGSTPGQNTRYMEILFSELLLPIISLVALVVVVGYLAAHLKDK